MPRRKKNPDINVFDPTPKLLVMLGSIAVHADEFTGPGGHHADLAAMRALLSTDDVCKWLDAMTARGLLPVKRNKGTSA